jgi:hypothetical protein
MTPNRHYRFGPLEQRAIVGSLRAGQLVFLGAGAAIGLGAFYTFGGFPGVVLALAALACAGASVSMPLQGRTVEEWTPIAVEWVVSGRGRRPFRSGVPEAGVSVDGAEREEPASLPPELSGIELLKFPYAGEEVGIIRDRRAGTYAAAIAVRAGAFALRDSTEQERSLEAWGGVLASCSREGSALRRLQWIERTLPGQGDALASYLQENRDRSVPFDSSVVSSYIELVEAAAPVTQEHEVLICLQVDAKKGGRDVKRLGGGVEGACELLMREAEALAQRLATADVTVFGLLRPRQYAEVIRDSFDPFGHQRRARAAIGDPDREGVDPSQMGPLAADLTWTHYRTDSALHRTFWVSTWPRSEVGPTFLAPLLMQSAVVRTVSVTIEPVPFSRAIRQAEMAQTAEVADEMTRAKHGFETTARIRKRAQAVNRREEELASGHAAMRFAKFITVSEQGLEALERSSADIVHAGQLARLELQPMYGEQDAGFANTLPLCRGLR